MALQSQLVSSFTSNVQHRVFFLSPSLTIRSQNQKASDSESSKPGVGFGSWNSNASGSGSSKRKQKQKGGSRERERASIIRRSPVEKPAFVSEQEADKEQSKNESAFLLAWLGFGALILVEGIALAASGFLPEEWDKFLVKYLYPSFTPTVFLFVAGAVAYGVFKYLQNDKVTRQK